MYQSSFSIQLLYKLYKKTEQLTVRWGKKFTSSVVSSENAIFAHVPIEKIFGQITKKQHDKVRYLTSLDLPFESQMPVE